MTITRTLACVGLAVVAYGFDAHAQSADPADVATPEAIVLALYETIQRPPGRDFQWDRMRTLYHPAAVLLPNPEQTGGESRTMSVEDFIGWVDSHTVVGGENDRGFQEEQIARRVVGYGDVAHVLSTYQKHYWRDPRILGRGINSIQLVYRDGRWWILSVAWDEESAAGPIPHQFLTDR